MLRGHSSWYTTHEAGLALEVGDLDKAAQLFDELRPGVGLMASSWYGLAVHIACRRGDLAEARRMLPELVSLVAVTGAEGQLLHDVSAALLAAGASVDEVRPLRVAGTIVVDGAPGRVGQHAWPSLLAGQLLEAAGQYDDAVTAYEDASVARRRHARLRTDRHGARRCGRDRSSRSAGSTTPVATSKKAAQLLEHWRGWRVDDLHAVERRLGIGPDVAGPDALTPREREVVALLAEGLSNAELAARLYISPKTAAVHVSNILAKLGMASRAEIAAFAAREGVSSAPSA